MICFIESSMQEHVASALEEMARMEIAELNRKFQFFPIHIFLCNAILCTVLICTLLMV